MKDAVVSGLDLQGISGEFVELLGNFSLNDSNGNVNFGLSFSFLPIDVGIYPKSVITKGTFSLSYDNEGHFYVSFGGVTQTLYSYFACNQLRSIKRTLIYCVSWELELYYLVMYFRISS